MIRFGAALAVLLLLAGCGTPEGLQETPPTWGNPFHGQEYRVVDVRENGKHRPLVRGTSPVLRFGNDETISLWGGCNRLGGPVAVDPKRLRAAALETTDLDCRDRTRTAQDRWLGDLLTGGVAWENGTDTLTLTAGGTRIRLHRVVLEAPPLVGTWWHVVGIVRSGTTPPPNPDDLSTRVPSSVDAWLTFDGKRVTGSTGCNRFSGPAVVGADHIVTPGPIVTTRMACTGPAADVERALLTLFREPYFGWGPDRRSVTLDYGGNGVRLA